MKKFNYDCEDLSNEMSEHYVFHFINDYGASVVKTRFDTPFMFVSDDYYELAVLKNGEITYDTPITGDILRLEEDEVESVLRQIEAL